MARWMWVWVLAALAPLSGCQMGRFLAYFLAPRETTVDPEFEGLPGKTVAVIVYADKRVQYEHPNFTLTLSSAVAGELGKNVSKVKVVDPRRVVRYQDDHIYWDEMDKTALGNAFGADYVLFVSVVTFTTREPGSLNLYRGRIHAELSIYDTAKAERGARIWRAEDLKVLYPEHTPTGELRESDSAIRDSTERTFADRLAKKFYKHKVPTE